MLKSGYTVRRLAGFKKMKIFLKTLLYLLIGGFFFLCLVLNVRADTTMVVLNSASNLTCDDICINNGGVCQSVGDDVNGTNTNYWYDFGSGCEENIGNTTCANSTMFQTFTVCEGNVTEWTNCSCLIPTSTSTPPLLLCTPDTNLDIGIITSCSFASSTGVTYTNYNLPILLYLYIVTLFLACYATFFMFKK